MVVAGLEEPANSPRNASADPQSGAESGAVETGFATLTAKDRARIVAGFDKLPSDLKRVIVDAAWAALPDKIKGQIQRVVGGTKDGADRG
jgi:hypothetical protein